MQGSANVSNVSAKFQENSEPHILHNLLGAEAEEKVIMGVGISGGVRLFSHT